MWLKSIHSILLEGKRVYNFEKKNRLLIAEQIKRQACKMILSDVLFISEKVKAFVVSFHVRKVIKWLPSVFLSYCLLIMGGEAIHGSKTVKLSQKGVNSILQLWKVLLLRLLYEYSCTLHGSCTVFFVSHPDVTFARDPAHEDIVILHWTFSLEGNNPP